MSSSQPITWDAPKDRIYEYGVSKGVIYIQDDHGAYKNAYAWNGLTNVTDKPSGADNQKFYADNIEYASMRATETYGASIEAYTYPPEFGVCDGTAKLTDGVTIGQQERKPFGLCWRTEIGNAENGMGAGYKIHIAYGMTVSPSEQAHDTVNESPEAATFSWEAEAQPVSVAGFKPTAKITIDSTVVTPENMQKLEQTLYGTAENPAELPLPDAIKTLLTSEAA